jgi:hypothetical protein
MRVIGMSLSFAQQQLALATSALWPPERLAVLAASSTIPVTRIKRGQSALNIQYQQLRAARPKPPPSDPETADLPVAAFALLVARPVTSIYHSIKRGIVPAVQIDGVMMIPRAWINEHPGLSIAVPPAQRGADGRFHSETS